MLQTQLNQVIVGINAGDMDTNSIPHHHNPFGRFSIGIHRWDVLSNQLRMMESSIVQELASSEAPITRWAKIPYTVTYLSDDCSEVIRSQRSSRSETDIYWVGAEIRMLRHRLSHESGFSLALEGNKQRSELPIVEDYRSQRPTARARGDNTSIN